jgi:CO/xanthine dehydrogenase FAD-binding subunit
MLLDYLSPDSLESAARDYLTGEDIALIAGGTDLIPLLKLGVRKPKRLLSLAKVEQLKQVSLRGEGLFVGSMVPLAGVIENSLVRKRLPVLVECAQSVASPQVRNQGTVGGNLLQERRCHYFNQTESWRANLPACYALGGGVCHQTPSSKVCRALYYSDLAPVLLAFDAWAEILEEGGPRTLSLQELIHIHTTGVKRKFILKGIGVPDPSPGTWGKFLKASVRSAIDFALADVAVRYSPPGRPEENPRIEIVVSALSPEPFRLEETARKFSQKGNARFRQEIVEAALKEAESKMAPIRETAVSAKTKRQSLAILARAMEDLLSVMPS